MFEKFQAVIFDVDGTLVDLMAENAKSYQQTFWNVLKIRIKDPRFFLSLFALGSEKAVFEEVLTQNGIAPSDVLLKGLVKDRTRTFAALARNVNPRNIIANVLQTIRALKAAGKKVYCVSGNNRKTASAILKKNGRLVLFGWCDFFCLIHQNSVPKKP